MADQPRTGGSEWIVGHALALLNEHACRRLFRLCDLAYLMGKSEWSLSCRIKRATGRSVPQHIHDRRVERAKHLLATTSKSVKEIAADVGYDRTSDLDREFVKRLSITPRAWRNGCLTASPLLTPPPPLGAAPPSDGGDTASASRTTADPRRDAARRAGGSRC